MSRDIPPRDSEHPLYTLEKILPIFQKDPICSTLQLCHIFEDPPLKRAKDVGVLKTGYHPNAQSWECVDILTVQEV